jgi:U3 small nucleolar RNA-associated protein 4
MGYVISGDSDGHLKFWEQKFGTLVKDFHTHKSGILAVISNEFGVFASGTDSKIFKVVCEAG